MQLIIFGSLLFTVIILGLSLLILFAKKRLLPSGKVKIVVNEDQDKAFEVQAGGKLLNAMADNGIFVSSACGGGGACGQCKVVVHDGGGSILPTEKAHVSKKEEREGVRLSCQCAVKQSMNIEVPPEVFSAKEWHCEVISNDNVATYIKELALRLPEDMDFQSGGYIQIQVPPYKMSFADIEIPDRFKEDWECIRHLESSTSEKIERAYSMANYKLEKGIVKLNVRIATPPFNSVNIPPGKGSSYVWSLKKGDKVTISGPFGHFCAQDTDNEMIVIGGGAGMAPLRSIIFDQLERVGTDRKISFWYGARSLKELFYKEDFDCLAEKYDNFTWHLALSDPMPEDNWKGHVGYIHKIVNRMYLKDHPAPEDCEYYLCGPPPMINSVLKTLDHNGVEPENIFFDDFGG